VSASSPDVFLLGCAAIANITFMDTMACDLLLIYRTAEVLTDAANNTDLVQSLYAKDQVNNISSVGLNLFYFIYISEKVDT
jgi:hypothetical protein